MFDRQTQVELFLFAHMLLALTGKGGPDLPKYHPAM